MSKLNRYRIRSRVTLKIPYYIFLFAFSCLPTLVSAQMFSVNTARDFRTEKTSSLGLYYDLVSFEYAGTNDLSPRFDFQNSTNRIHYENEFASFGLILANKLGEYSGSLFSIYGSLSPTVTVSESRWHQFDIPITFSTEYMRIRSATNVITEELLWSTLGVGVGPSLALKYSSRVELRGGVSVSRAMLTRNNGIENGNVKGLVVPIRFKINDIFGGYGITVGYQFSNFRYRVESGRYDYNRQGDGWIIGVNF
jgi:hypothetical protein